MKSILPIAGIFAASIAAAGAANYSTGTVGVINGNSRSITEATGNSLTATTFGTAVGTAFANDTGGVWNFDGSFFTVGNGETITLDYGTSSANSIVMTLSGTNGILQSFDNPTTEPTSGETMLGLGGDASTRTFTLSTNVLTIGIFSTDRNSTGRNPQLTVTYLDNTTASTSGANADNYFFHGLSGTVANPIKSFSLSQEGFVRYDDLGFIAVPEPSSAALLGLVGFGALLRRRR